MVKLRRADSGLAYGAALVANVSELTHAEPPEGGFVQVLAGKYKGVTGRVVVSSYFKTLLV